MRRQWMLLHLTNVQLLCMALPQRGIATTRRAGRHLRTGELGFHSTPSRLAMVSTSRPKQHIALVWSRPSHALISVIGGGTTP